MAGLYKRGAIWWGRAQRQNKEQRVSLETKNRAIAEKRLREWLADLDAIKWGDKPRRTFDEASERFVRQHLITVKPSTARRYGDSLKHLALHFGGKTLDQIKSAALSDFETARRSEGVTPATVRRDLSCLSGIFASAIDWEWLEDGGIRFYPLCAVEPSAGSRRPRHEPATYRPRKKITCYGMPLRYRKSRLSLPLIPGCGGKSYSA